MSTTLNVYVLFLKEKRCSSGKEALNSIKLHAFKQSRCAMVHIGSEMFHKIVCSSADARYTWVLDVSCVRKGDVGNWHVNCASVPYVSCIGRAEPTQNQLSAQPAIRSALAANPSSAPRWYYGV